MKEVELVLTPAGHLKVREGIAGAGKEPGAWQKRVVAAFSTCQAAGLFSLAATRPTDPPEPDWVYWRDFAGLYLTELCRTPEGTGATPAAVEPPAPPELEGLVSAAPPMAGGEYLSPAMLRDLWLDLDGWVREEVAGQSAGLSEWLRQRAPVWHQVGRVCFHLAENRRDEEFPFAFLATYAPRLSKGGRVQYQPLGAALREYAGARNKDELVKLLSPVQKAAEKLDFVKKLVDSGDIFHSLAWTPAEAYVLLKHVPSLEESGLLVRLPDWWRKRPRVRVSVTIGERKQNLLGVDAMLDFSVGLALGDEKLDAKEWKEIQASAEGLVNIRGRWVEVDREKLSQALDHWKKVESEVAGEGISFVEGMRMLAGAPADLGSETAVEATEHQWSHIEAGGWLQETLSGLRHPEGLAAGWKCAGFRGQLRPYQETGCRWLWLLSNLGLGACLADDMGLGKTVQIISLLLAMKERGATKSGPTTSLLVLPASLLANWKAELQRFAPSLKAVYIHPSESESMTWTAAQGNGAKALSKVDVVLTTYGMLPREKWLLKTKWLWVILDEAQAIKNPSTLQTKTVKQLQASSRIALTGTPIENRLSDLWSLFDFICPGLLGSTLKFKKFVKGLEERGSDRYAPLRNLVQPYILRRLKTDKSIISDLPDKTEVKAFCGLSKRQTALYATSVAELSTALKGLDGIKRRGLVLAFLMRLKQICNHPSQWLGDGGYDPADSGKFERLRSICQEIASRQEKVLVFTQFREMTEPVSSFLAETFGHPGLVLHGGTAVKKRRSLVEAFQSEDGPAFFVLSLKAGGTGLNLTQASHVIHFDRWWNPAVENQATDRAFRIGQHRHVMVHKFISRGTVEEKIDALIGEKASLADDILKAGAESLLTEMSNEELLKIVALDIDRADTTGELHE